jgi:hypothetical protein
MEGGAMVGYCATGRVRTAKAPASIRTIAITQAKTGRSMKNCACSGTGRERSRKILIDISMA